MKNYAGQFRINPASQFPTCPCSHVKEAETLNSVVAGERYLLRKPRPHLATRSCPSAVPATSPSRKSYSRRCTGCSSLFCRVVQRAHVLVCRLGVANRRMADAPSDVPLNNPVHLRIAHQLHLQLRLLEHRVPRQLRCGHEESGVELVGFIAGRAEVLEDVRE